MVQVHKKHTEESIQTCPKFIGIDIYIYIFISYVTINSDKIASNRRVYG